MSLKTTFEHFYFVMFSQRPRVGSFCRDRGKVSLSVCLSVRYTVQFVHVDDTNAGLAIVQV